MFGNLNFRRIMNVYLPQWVSKVLNYVTNTVITNIVQNATVISVEKVVENDDHGVAQFTFTVEHLVTMKQVASVNRIVTVLCMWSVWYPWKCAMPVPVLVDHSFTTLARWWQCATEYTAVWISKMMLHWNQRTKIQCSSATVI